MGQFDGETSAYLAQYESDEAARSTPEVARKFLSFVAEKAEPLAGKLGVAILTRLSSETEFDVVEFAKCVVAEFARVGRNLNEIDDSVRALRIFLHAADEARRVHDREKISRLAAIVTTGIINPLEPSQKIDEFIRIAGILIDADILVLKAIFENQRELLQNYLRASRRFSRDETQQHIQNAQSNMESSWSTAIYASWKDLQFIPAGSSESLERSSIRSAILRLEAVGLIADVPSTGVDGPVYGRPCALMELGYEFIRYLQVASPLRES